MGDEQSIRPLGTIQTKSRGLSDTIESRKERACIISIFPTRIKLATSLETSSEIHLHMEDLITDSLLNSPPEGQRIRNDILIGPHDTQNCMENPEQAFVDYASTRTDEAGENANPPPTQPVLPVALRARFTQELQGLQKISAFIDSRLERRGFLATANAVIDCRVAKITVGEGITRSIFGVKGLDLGEEEDPYWTTLGKRESYKLRPRSEGIGAKPSYYARKDFLDCHLPGEWDISRDAELNPFKDTLVFRRMVEFLGAIPINLKCNMWESEDLIENKID
ncbi:hypothetical protein Tco_0822633 [Tanacetum coccineum]|uniref:MAK10-like protein n=1 Tax=Tanacetum coccineum TaxID=301880 RepID=A0ABQ5AKJ7_9ASTR